ncbi:hypothetical protein Bca4012_051340 [Brassica carinata]|uniref:BnaC02g29870D protein n=1 Tax=Brassica napus TaxID=3708 RepID=A0A078FF08_BRANA|nr:BnaC02g29870D [Brassica napus]
MMAFMGDCAHADLLVPPIEGRIHELWDPIPVSPAGLACRSRLTRRKPRRTLRAKAGKWIRLRAPFERPCREISWLILRERCMCSLILWLYLFGPDVAILCFRVVWSSVAV